MTRITDPCPSCGQPSHRIHFPAHPRNNDGSAFIEVVAGVLILAMFVVGLMAWSWILEAAR